MLMLMQHDFAQRLLHLSEIPKWSELAFEGEVVFVATVHCHSSVTIIHLQDRPFLK